MNITCPVCEKGTKVVDSRPTENNTIRRRRHCLNNRCKERFSTYEIIDDEYHDFVEAWNIMMTISYWAKQIV